MSVAIGWDDLWIAAICQSNLEIAGSPRKVFRHRGRVKIWSGRATGWAIERKQDISTKLRIIHKSRLDSHTGLSSCDERETTQTLS